jgi:diaminohydroxyphosphoribosylaminopyrimidine deaminase/5-amino-6-(5-phosphoribosylamino)uracil reductase
MFALPPLVRLADKIPLRFHGVTQVGDDLRILARFNPK